MSNVINVLSVVLFILCWLLIIKKILRNKCSPVKAVKARVFDKYKTGTVSKTPGIFRREHCIVVFSVNDKKLSFNVSEFSYGNYKIKDKGTLKYRGNQIISFK